MTKRILLCDDEVAIIKAAEFKLARAGFDVECAFDGQAGWEAVQRHKPDLIVTDCQMPRMGGLDLIKCVRSVPELRDLPIFMITGKGFELPADELKSKWGVREVLGKPFSPRELLQKVVDALAEVDAATLEHAHVTS
jgi:CheY-like chemotaxis protein